MIVLAKTSKKTSHGDSKFFELKTFSYKPRSHTSVDHEFSKAKRIVHDTKQSLKVAEALDAEFGRTDMPDGISALLRDTEVGGKVSYGRWLELPMVNKNRTLRVARILLNEWSLQVGIECNVSLGTECCSRSTWLEPRIDMSLVVLQRAR